MASGSRGHQALAASVPFARAGRHARCGPVGRRAHCPPGAGCAPGGWRRRSVSGPPGGRASPASEPPTDRLRVVYLDHCARLSGAELALLRLLPALDEDVEAHVILGENGPLVSRLKAVGVTTEVLPMIETARGLARESVHLSRFPPATLLHTARYITEVARRLRQLRPDLVHTNSLKAGLYGSVAGRLSRVPVIWHLREQLTPDHLPAAAASLVRAAVHRLPTAVIANSRSTLGSVATPGLVSSVIASPVELGPSRGTRRSEEPLRVGMVGRIAPIKGQHVFLEAFARAFPQGPTRAVIVGTAMFGETDYEEQLRRQVGFLGLEGRVEMAGFREDVGEELGRLDVLVQASVIAEGFGQVVVEGMAAGLPVVAPGAGGPAEIITDGRDGLLVPPGDVPALAASLRRLAGDEALRHRLGEAARKRALDFTPAAIAPQVLALYRTVLGR